MTLTLSKKAALLFLIVIPVLGGTLLFIAKKAHPHFIKVFDEYDDLNNSVQENVNAARVVKAFVREDYEIDKFHGVSKYVYQLFTTAAFFLIFLIQDGSVQNQQRSYYCLISFGIMLFL